MPKASKLGDLVAVAMGETLESESFQSLFTPAKSEKNTSTTSVNSQASADFAAFERFAKKKKKDEEAEETDEGDKKDSKKDKKSDKDSKNDKSDDKKSDKKDSKKSDKKPSKKDDKDAKKGKKAVAGCSCSKGCGCKSEEKCPCEGKCSAECMDCGDGMYASAIRYIVEQFVRTSAALDEMGLSKSAIATMATLDHIIEEAAMNRFAQNAENFDENDIRGMDALLGLDDPEAFEDLDDEMDDPASAAVLEDILTSNPEMVDELREGIKARLQNISDSDPDSNFPNSESLQYQLESVEEEEPESSDNAPTLLAPVNYKANIPQASSTKGIEEILRNLGPTGMSYAPEDMPVYQRPDQLQETMPAKRNPAVMNANDAFASALKDLNELFTKEAEQEFEDFDDKEDSNMSNDEISAVLAELSGE